MTSVRGAAQGVLVYFGLARREGEPVEPPNDLSEKLGLLALIVFVPSQIGARRGLILALVVAALYLPLAFSRSPTLANRWAEATAVGVSIFALVTMLLSRHASLWIPIACALAFSALAAPPLIKRAP